MSLFVAIIIIVFLLLAVMAINFVKYRVVTCGELKSGMNYLLHGQGRESGKKDIPTIEDEIAKPSFPLKACSVDIERCILRGDEPPPNIIFALYDGRRLDDFSFTTNSSGGRRITPFFDELQKDCISFINAIAPNVWSFPSHASFFSGLSPKISQSDCGCPYDGTFPDSSFSIAELLKKMGYETIVFSDHPFFLFGGYDNSLCRGFTYFDVIGKYPDLTCTTNIGTEKNEPVVTHPKLGIDFEFDHDTLASIDQFNDGTIRFNDLAGEISHGKHEVVYPQMDEFFENSPFFEERYKKRLDILFEEKGKTPFFLFLNLHFSDIAVADDRLLSGWKLRFLMLNAQAREMKLSVPKEGEGFDDFFVRNLKAILGMESWRVKHQFDNQFYDYSFKRIVEYFRERELMENTVLIATSDHGFSFGEHKEQRYSHNCSRPYDYLVEVPLIMKFPEKSPFQKYHDEYFDRISLTDLFYTLLHIATGDDLSTGIIGLYENNIHDEGNPDVCNRKHDIDYSFGKSIISRIERRDFDDAIFTVQNVSPYYCDTYPFTAGEVSGIYYKDYKWMYSNNMKYTIKFTFNPKVIHTLWAKDNIRKLLFLMNPVRIFRTVRVDFDQLFSAKNGEYRSIMKPEIVNELLRLFSDYHHACNRILEMLYRHRHLSDM